MFYKKYRKACKQRKVWKQEVRNLLMQDPGRANRVSRHYYKLWRASLTEGRNPVEDASPWITYAAIDLLENYLTSGMRVFEWGGRRIHAFFL